MKKVVVITGASSGIGKALAEAYADTDTALVLGARNTDKLNALAAQLKPVCGDVLAVQADVSKEEDCEKLIQHAVEKFGAVDVLINNAGISMRAIFEDLDVKVLKNLMDVNFWGTVYCSKFALPHLLKSRGSLVGISSIAGYKGLPGRTGYSASKFAMHGFLETVRIENLKKGLHVLIACPGFTSSNIRKTALGGDGLQQGESPRNEAKMMSAETAALHIKKAIQKRKTRLVLTTQGKLTVLLNKFFPSLVDKMVYRHMAKEPDSPFR